jgi:hypothetical protein
MLVVTNLNGNPVFNPVLIQTFSTSCSLSVAGSVPPGFGGISSSFQAFGFSLAGELIASNSVAVQFL